MAKHFYSLGLVGYPLEHSVSPTLHSAALKTSGLGGAYLLYPVEPLPQGKEKLHAIVGRIKTGQLSGLNITIPHKINIINELDKTSPAANLIGAVNTLYIRNEQIVGDNTDAKGFMLDLDRFLFQSGKSQEISSNMIPKQALVLGAGGAARAVVYSLIEGGWDVIIAARKPTQSQEIAHSIGSISSRKKISTIKLDKHPISSVDDSFSLIVNTTPVGMLPDENNCPWPRDLDLPSNGMVYDLVYKPRHTKFYKLAREHGLPVANGIGMLVEQAALAFELWTGISPSRNEMLKAIRL